MAQILGLTNSQGHGDWTMFDNFMTALMHAHPLGERELNAERLGPYGKDKADYFWRCGPNNDPFHGRGGGIFPAAVHTIPFEEQVRFASLVDRRPAPLRAALEEDTWGAEWVEWVQLSQWLVVEFGAYFPAVAAAMAKRDRGRELMSVIEQAIVFGVLLGPCEGVVGGSPPPLFMSPAKVLRGLNKAYSAPPESEEREQSEKYDSSDGNSDEVQKMRQVLNCWAQLD